MNHHNVKIVRKGKSNTQMALGWLNLILACLRPFARQEQEVRLGYMEELKAEKIQKDIQVAEQRGYKESNNVVIGDLRIEKLKMENKLLKAKLHALGVDQEPFAPDSDYGPRNP